MLVRTMLLGTMLILIMIVLVLAIPMMAVLVIAVLVTVVRVPFYGIGNCPMWSFVLCGRNKGQGSEAKEEDVAWYLHDDEDIMAKWTKTGLLYVEKINGTVMLVLS